MSESESARGSDRGTFGEVRPAAGLFARCPSRQHQRKKERSVERWRAIERFVRPRSVERRHVGPDRERVDFREARLPGRPLAELPLPEFREAGEVRPIGEDGPRGEAPLVGEIGPEAFDRAGKRDHGKSVTPAAAAARGLESAPVELRPFRCLRHAPRVILERGPSALLGRLGGAGAPSGGEAPESLAPLFASAGSSADPEGAARKLSEWIASGVLLRERRPALWIYRRSPAADGAPPGVPILVGLVRLGTAAPATPLDPRTPEIERHLALRRATKADFEPCRLSTRAPLSGALATTRRPDFSAEDSSGARHDAWRVHDYAQHVELQGLVKNAEVEIERGQALWEAARRFEAEPEAAKLPGARFKLCAIAEADRDATIPEIPLGLFGVSLEDPVY